MIYFASFCIIFGMVGLRAFMQKVVNANQYPIMSFMGGSIYICEGSAVWIIARGDFGNVLAGAVGAAMGAPLAVYLYNRYCINLFKKKVLE